MSVVGSPLPNATKTSRGAIAPGAQELPAGPKTLQDLLKLAGDWSHDIDPGGGLITITGAPIELGDLSTASFADLTTLPGVRRYTVGGNTEMLLGTLSLGIVIAETEGKLYLNGTIDSVTAGSVSADAATFGGTTLLNSSGVTIGAGASLSAPAATIDDISVTTLTIAGDPYVRRLIDSVDTSTGLGLSGGVLSLSAASGSTPGAMTGSSQSFDGAKTFTAQLTASAALRVGGALKAAGAINLSTDFVSVSFGNLDLDTSGSLGLRLYALNGASSGDRSVFIGTSANGVNSNAKLLQVGWNLGASEALAVYPGLLVLTSGKAASALGALSSDVAFTVGTTLADASVNSSATLLSVRTGMGGTENEKFAVTKSAVKVGVAARGTPVALTSSSASIAVNAASANNFTHTTTENTTLANPSNLVAGQHGSIVITQGATPRTMAYGTYWKFAGGAAPTLTATASAVDVLTYYVVNSTFIIASLIKDVK